jgi:hypothetical protein
MGYKTKRSKVVKCDLTISDLVGMADGIFEGNHDPARHGWVTMAANLKGRACVNALFPKAHIAWRDPGEGLPIDWLGFDINVPDVIAATATKLPLNKARLDERIRRIVGVVESGLFISRADPVFVADAAGVHRRYS